MKQQTKIIVLAVLISLLVHGAFLAASPHIILHGMGQVLERTRQMFRIKEVEKTPQDVALLKGSKQEVASIKMSQNSPGLDKMAFKDMMMVKKDIRKPLESKKEDLEKQKLEDLKASQSLDSILKAAQEKAKKDIASKPKTLDESLTTENLVARPVISDASDRELTFEVSDVSSSTLMDQSTWSPNDRGNFNVTGGEIARSQGNVQIGSYEDIGKHLEVDLHTYTDPSTKEKFFRISINVKKDSPIEVIPKEMIFLIDSSKSITEDKLSFAKDGILKSLKELNPGDRFNLVAFKGDLIKFKNSSVRATDKTIAEAKPFITQLEATGQTDVENALLGIIRKPLVYYPSYILLFTDGRPTTGAMDSRRIIQEITRQNNMIRPIFCFGGGLRVNKYLLDFISYQNRAWSKFANATQAIARDFVEFYNQIKDPILLNVRYRLNSLSSKEVYPKYLSDFYKGRPFVLYGKYTDEDKFSMQLLGEIGEIIKEFIFQRSLAEAEEGGPEIAKEWAFRKIYYLISQNTMGKGNTAGLRQEIDSLSRKYNITTPYDIENGD